MTSFLCRVKEIINFTYEPCGNKLFFFINVPSTDFGKQICFEWYFECLLAVAERSPTKVRAYDYLEKQT